MRLPSRIMLMPSPGRMVSRSFSAQAPRASGRLAAMRIQVQQDAAAEDETSWTDAVSVVEPVKKGRVAKQQQRHPDWLKVQRPGGEDYMRIRNGLRASKLATVCEEARCPNIGECWSSKKGAATATIMVLGDTCTRGCRFCNVKTSRTPPLPADDEPEKTAEAIASWSVDYVVITSVDRDDIFDGGAEHYARVVRRVKVGGRQLGEGEAAAGGRRFPGPLSPSLARPSARVHLSHLRTPQTTNVQYALQPASWRAQELKPTMRLECLTPDFNGTSGLDGVATVATAGLDVYAHNIETVERLQRTVRDRRAGYGESIRVLEHARKVNPKVVTKTSIILGFGEEPHEIRQTMRDMRDAGVEIFTLGQYLRPSKRHMKVARMLTPEEYDGWRDEGMAMGFKYVASGPLVRSSYKAGEVRASLRGRLGVLRGRVQREVSGGRCILAHARPCAYPRARSSWRPSSTSETPSVSPPRPPREPASSTGAGMSGCHAQVSGSQTPGRSRNVRNASFRRAYRGQAARAPCEERAAPLRRVPAAVRLHAHAHTSTSSVPGRALPSCYVSMFVWS